MCRKKSIEEVREIVEGKNGNGCKLLSTEYINNKTPLDILCACGEPFPTTLSSFNKGKKQCDKCGIKKKENKVTFKCDYCHEEKTVKKSDYEGHKHHFCSRECKDKWQVENLKGDNNPTYGKERLDMKGENNPRYNPNLTEEDKENRRHIEGYNDFIKNVYKRDNYTCQCCGEKGNGHNLNAHHINGYNWDKDNRTNIDNGICLCKDCHSKFHKIYGRGYNTLKQFIEFIQAQNYSHLIKPLNQTYFKLNYNKVS